MRPDQIDAAARLLAVARGGQPIAEFPDYLAQLMPPDGSLKGSFLILAVMASFQLPQSPHIRGDSCRRTKAGKLSAGGIEGARTEIGCNDRKTQLPSEPGSAVGASYCNPCGLNSSARILSTTESMKAETASGSWARLG
jgi:hypothetical protein